jgi:hypothetical protein
MSTSTKEMIARLKALNVTVEAQKSFDETENTVLDLNKKQMKDGLLSNSEPITYLHGSHYPYSGGHTRTRLKLGLQVEVVDLRITGKFYSSEFIERNGNEIEYSSSIKLGEYLEEMYGYKIFGMTQKSREKYTSKEYWQALKKNIESVIKLKFHK